MSLIKLVSLFSYALILTISFFGISLPMVVSANPASDKQRFQEVADQLDLGGVLYGYVSVEGDLESLTQYLDSFMSGMKAFEKGIPDFDANALLRISGLDSISALGMSSIRTDDGFRNKVYLHAPQGQRGFLALFGNEVKPFEVLELAPAGADLVFQQDIKLKTFYDEVVMEALGGEPSANKNGSVVPPLGPQGLMMKLMVEGAMKQPLPPPFTFTMEKLMADLDTQLTIIIDADPTKMIPLPDGNGIQIPKIQGAVLVDGLGWVADEFIKMLRPELAKGGTRVPPFKILQNDNWAGVQIALESKSFSKKDRNEIRELGWSTAMLAHHRPSGKLILTSGKKFAESLFSPKQSLATDPVFLATTQGLPKKGTALSYISPVFMLELRKLIHKAIDLENPEEKEYKRDDRFAAYSMLDLFLPEGALGEGIVTTTSKDGLLTVSNSMYSHKSKILLGAAGPLVLGVFTFTAVQAVDKMFEPHDAFQDLEAPDAIPDKHDHKVVPEKPSSEGN